MARIEHGKPLHTVQEPRIYEKVFYTSTERPIGRPYRVFKLEYSDPKHKPFPHRKLIHIAAMVRHLAIEAMKHDPPRGVDTDWIERYIAGHAGEGVQDHRQLSYLPLQSIGRPHTDPGVRRVMIVAPVGDDAWLNHVARHLASSTLEPQRGDEFGGDEPPLLIPVRNDNIAPYYTKPSNLWTSVTPVILPGHDDHKPAKRMALIEKALAQSGIDQPCEFEWSAFSRFRKPYSAHKYDKDKRPQGYIRPGYLVSQTAVHLTLRFKDGLKFPGPIAIGAGRHCGLGVLASESAT
jgi:CRISPR-associated protein Csb2